MPKMLILLYLACFLSSAWAEGGSISDVQGWQNTQWGMTPEELKSLYGDSIAVTKRDGAGEILTLANYELFGSSFLVKFFWKDGDKLSRVIVVTTELETDLSILAGKLKSSLIGKYGEGKVLENEHSDPSFLTLGKETIETPGSDSMEIRWLFPSTMITYRHLIQMLGIARPGLSNISITYEPNQADKL